MGISKRNPRGNFNWQTRYLKKKAICCGQLDEPIDCNTLAPVLSIGGNNMCITAPSEIKTITCTNTAPGQATDTLYEWYEGSLANPPVYSSNGPISSYSITADKTYDGTVFFVKATNIFGCETIEEFTVYVSYIPSFTIAETDPTIACTIDVLDPLGQYSNGIITATITSPDPDSLYYVYRIERTTLLFEETIDTGSSFTWNDLCFGTYTIMVELYRLIDGVATMVCSDTVIYNFGPFILTWDNIANVPVADPNDVSQWNTWLSFVPQYVYNFTNVTVVGNSVYLSGGNTVDKLYFVPFGTVTNLVGIEDYGGYLNAIDNNASANNLTLEYVYFSSVQVIGSTAFLGCTSLQSVVANIAIDIDDAAFQGCTSLVNIEAANCSSLGATVLNDSVFLSIIGNTITATFKSSLQTVNAGGLEGDLAYLNTNNTVTFTWV